MVETLDELSVVSVQDLAHLLRDGLATLFPEHLWIEGQVSNFHDARSGHAYFDLVEPSEVPGQAVAARLSVALFKGCLLYTSPSPRDKRQSRMPSSA